jgi:SAM-dependent methyltransferase
MQPQTAPRRYVTGGVEPLSRIFRALLRFIPCGPRTLLEQPRAGWVCLALLATCGAIYSQPLRAQAAQAANQEYLTPEGRRNAAFEMAHPNRSRLEQSARLIQSFGLKPGDEVADVGSGVGFLLPYIIDAVGPAGRVIAEDIQPDFIAEIQKKIESNTWPNAAAVLGSPTDPRLPHSSLDAALLVDAYHHLDYPGELIHRIREALRPRGRLIVADFYNSRSHPRATPEVLKQHIRADRDQVANEIAAEGFHLVGQFDHLPHEYVLVFEKQAPSEDTQR